MKREEESLEYEQMKKKALEHIRSSYTPAFPARELSVSHSTAVTKLAAQENRQGYMNPDDRIGALDSFSANSSGCLSVAMTGCV